MFPAKCLLFISRYSFTEYYIQHLYEYVKAKIIIDSSLYTSAIRVKFSDFVSRNRLKLPLRNKQEYIKKFCIIRLYCNERFQTCFIKWLYSSLVIFLKTDSVCFQTQSNLRYTSSACEQFTEYYTPTNALIVYHIRGLEL